MSTLRIKGDISRANYQLLYCNNLLYIVRTKPCDGGFWSVIDLKYISTCDITCNYNVVRLDHRMNMRRAVRMIKYKVGDQVEWIVCSWQHQETISILGQPI